MSMERQMKESSPMQAVKEDGNEATSFLDRVRKLGRSNRDSQGSNLSNLSKESSELDTGNESSLNKSNHVEMTKAEVSQSPSDEGLGESFDQNSECSDGSLDRRIGADLSEQLNGLKNNKLYDTVHEEDKSPQIINDANHRDVGGDSRRSSQKSGHSIGSSDELPLDPNKLPKDGTTDINEDISKNGKVVDGKKPLAKSVSFYGDDKISEIKSEPVSNTFVYNEEKGEKGKKSGWFGKRRGVKK